SRACALQSRELRLGVTRSFLRGAQLLICSQLQVETLLSLLEFLARSFRGVLSLLKLHLRARAQFNLNQRIVFLHELAWRDENVADARLEGDRNGMRLTGLRDHASINDHFFVDGFSLHFRDLHLWNRASLFFVFSNL